MDDPCFNLDQPGLQVVQGQIGHFFGQISAQQEDAEIASQRMKLWADFVLHPALAGQRCPIDCLLVLLDVLLIGATLVEEPNDPAGHHRQVSDRLGRALDMPIPTRFELSCESKTNSFFEKI